MIRSREETSSQPETHRVMSHRTPWASPLALLALAGLATLLAPRATATAQPFAQTIRAEAGLSMLVSSPHRDRFGLGGGIGGSYELRLHRYVGIEGHLSAILFSAGEGDGSFGSYYAPSVGARLHPLPDLEGLDLFASLRLALAVTGGEIRPGLELDAGIEFEITSQLSAGPFLRYAHVLQPDGNSLGPANGQFLMLGVLGSMQLEGEARDSSEGAADEDSDGDGLPDAEDGCPSRPEDADGFEDADGCPDPDNDADGIGDGQDACPDRGEDADGFEDTDGCPDPDNDADGIEDTSDRCPEEAEDHDGDADEDGCPEEAPDSDGDGVRDDTDQCVSEAEDLDGFEDENGCPDPDNDQDGVLDADDECPRVPGDPRQGGCPRSVRMDAGQIRILQRIEFATNQARLVRRSLSILEEVQATLAANPQLRRVRIEGHTDSRGDEATNLRLSEERSQAVRRWLIEHGVEEGRLEAQGFGQARPLESNETQAGRRLNRRVEFHIVDPAPPEG
ncbi:MAG: OmpA family protein [Myxococcales bacterium]|nr:OmpA family protein [Myxococcales bacterium]